MNPLFVALGLAFLGLATAIVFKQQSATKCEKHDPLAGKVAMALAVICGGTGIAILIFAAMYASAPTGKSNLSAIVSGKGADELPANWKLVESDKYSYALAIPSEAIWDEHKVIWPPPGEPNYTFEVSTRNTDYPDQQYFDENRKFLVGANRLIFKANSSADHGKVHQFGIDHGDGLVQLCKIAINENFVYVLTATFDKELTGDPNIAAFFGLFVLKE